jgi:antitoxin VapB
MNLQIRDPRAHELASKLARKRGLSMTDAVIQALEAQLQMNEGRSRAERLASVRAIAANLVSQSPGGGRDMTKDEIDGMWGHD